MHREKHSELRRVDQQLQCLGVETLYFILHYPTNTQRVVEALSKDKSMSYHAPAGEKNVPRFTLYRCNTVECQRRQGPNHCSTSPSRKKMRLLCSSY
jgi:hypothetical protein